MVLSLQRLTEFYGLEIERGQAGLGNFNLRAGLLPVSLSSGAASRHIRAPESIVDTIRCGAVSSPSATASASSAQSTEASSSSSTAMSLSSDATPCVTDEPQDTTLVFQSVYPRVQLPPIDRNVIESAVPYQSVWAAKPLPVGLFPLPVDPRWRPGRTQMSEFQLMGAGKPVGSIPEREFY